MRQFSPLELACIDPFGATTEAYGKRTLNWKGKLKYSFLTWRYRVSLIRIVRAALSQKVLYYGPFKGEFGHFLLHNLPFLVYLHQRGVAIYYCGMALHKPFLIDEDGRSIVHTWYPLRDFFGEVRPSANETQLPPDVEGEVEKFRQLAKRSGFPFLDISEKDRYWFVFRNWQLRGMQSRYRLEAVYRRERRALCVIFPRKKEAPFTPNNGEPWDYAAIAESIAPFFDEVRLVGHPSMSAEVPASDKFKLCTSTDNADTLTHCAEAELIITQHSGAVHLGDYVDTPVLLIFKGPKPIKGLIDTLRFRQNIARRPLNYAFSYQEILEFVKSKKR